MGMLTMSLIVITIIQCTVFYPLVSSLPSVSRSIGFCVKGICVEQLEIFEYAYLNKSAVKNSQRYGDVIVTFNYIPSVDTGNK